MTEDLQGRQRKRKRQWLALALLAALLVALIVPPLVSVSRYKSRIAQLISASLGRPARLSSVELRLLPRPGFVLTDLTVDEDPAYGAEPLLHANSVTASIRLLSLWRGRLEIGSISVDEASFNLVRTEDGRWNLDSLFRTAAKAQPAEGDSKLPLPLPFLEATDSRINIKSGAEKLPFSLVETDASLRQQSPGEWRIQLRGQPARTDLSLEQADTGIVRLDATLHSAAQLRDLPLRLDLEWKDAPLGQLTRLILGSDSGWRGNLTGELHLEGTAESARIKTQLRATEVHRAEFAPAAPLDFDANCGFVYHFYSRAFENLLCDSPLGNGRIRFSADLPGEGAAPHISVELDRLPVQAALDALRTVRSGLGPGLEAKGAISGKIAYAESAPEKPAISARSGKTYPAKALAPAPGPLTGSFTVEGFQLSGEGLSEPIRVPKLVLEPMAALPDRQSNDLLSQTLAATAAFPAGGATPLAIHASLSLSGYLLTVRGQASIARARELARVAGLPDASALDAVAGDPIFVDLSAAGPWRPAEKAPFSGTSLAGAVVTPTATPAAPPAVAASGTPPVADNLTGTVTLRNANWKTDYLANHVEISQATLHIGDGETRWDPVVFSYGPVKGTASLTLPAHCDAPAPCLPRFEVAFGALDASALQSALLGAKERSTLLSTLIERLRPSSSISSAPAWPRLEGTVKAELLILGPVTLHEATATMRILENGAEIAALDAGLLGGRAHGTGTFHAAGINRDKPAYTLEAQFEKLSPRAVGQLLGLRWSDGSFDANGKVELSGFTDKDLAASAKGALHFEWRHGAAGGSVPAALARFDRWTADAEIANGALALQQDQVRRGAQNASVEATATFGAPPKVTFAAPKETQAKR
jgi:hypothetical protein